MQLAPSYPKITVRFGTNRNPGNSTELFGEEFLNPRNPAQYVTGRVDVYRVSNLPDSGWQVDLSSLVLDPHVRESADVSGQDWGEGTSAGPTAFLAELGVETLSFAARYGLVIIHGYSATFLMAMQRAAQVASAYRAQQVLAFSWPASEGSEISPRHYLRDRAYAGAAGAGLAEFLAQLFQAFRDLDAARRPVLHLVAHSMGNYVLRNAVQQIRVRRPDLIRNRVFEGALLMAADEDVDALARDDKLRALETLARHVEVYKSRADLALSAAQLVLSRARLGAYGPFRDGSAHPKTVTSVDVTTVGSTQGDNGSSHYGHQYYRVSPLVVADVLQVLAGIAPTRIQPRIRDMDVNLPDQAFELPFRAAEFQGLIQELELLRLDPAFAGEIADRECSGNQAGIYPDSNN